MLAAQAMHESRRTTATFSRFVIDGRELSVAAIARPDGSLARLLPAAELDVIRSLVEGCTDQQIARQRGTSTRTIANQISAVFRRLGVSGRNELVQRLFFESSRGPETLAPPPAAPEARRSA